MRPVRLDQLIHEAIEGMRALANARSVRIGAAIPPAPPAALTNPEKTQRVLFNLIDNAVRHTPAAGGVTVSLAVEAAALAVEVADSGACIDPAERDRVFEPLFRGGARAARPSDGAGLGLPICRAIVRNLGGEIRLVESERGARVRFTLPRA